MIGDGALMRLFTQYVEWQNYAATERARAANEEERSEARYGFEKAQHMIRNDPKPGQVRKVEATRQTDKVVLQAEGAVHQAKAVRRLSEVMEQNLERCAALVSRELSRRIAVQGGERRNMRWNP